VNLSQLNLISQPIRWEIMKALLSSSDGLTPTLLSARLKLKIDTVSHHLVTLRDADLVAYVPSGAHNLYFPNRVEIMAISEELGNMAVTPKSSSTL